MEKATKKEILSLVLAIMLLVLSACSAVNRAEEAEGTAAATTETAIETTEETTEETAAETTEATTEATEPTATEATEAQEVDAEITEATEPEPNAAIVNVKSYVNVRAEKSVSSEKVGTYAKGERIYIETVETSGGVRWGKTELGWVCMDYVQLDGEPAPANMDSADSDSAPATEETAVPAKAEQPAIEAIIAPTEAQDEDNTAQAAPEAEAEAAAPTEAAEQPIAAETGPAATECTHNWVTETTEEVGHYVAHIFCPCGAEFSTLSALYAHQDVYSPLEQVLSHGGWSNYDEYVVDTPATSRTYCTICGAEQ